jgi:hypothetical protein
MAAGRNASATVRRPAVLAVVAALAVLLGGCGWFGGDKSDAKSESVFTVRPGQCFLAPGKVQAQLSSLQRVPCSHKHTREAYAKVDYTGTGASGGSASTSAYPGSDALSTFAQGACAQRFAGYVGVDYLDSSLFFTYLMPSARSWEQQDDRTITCFVTSTGGTLTGSVKGSKR